MKQQICGNSSPDLIVPCINLSSYYCDLENFSEAEKYIYRAVEIAEKELVENHPVLGLAYQQLGCFYMAKEDYKVSERHLFKSLGIIQAVFPWKHRLAARIHAILGDLYYE